jgi:cytochrome c550
MKRNPVVPYILIMVFGIALMFILSFKGLGDSKELAKENGEGGGNEKTEVAATKPEDIYKQSCIACHGDQYQGVVGPKLKGTGLSKDEVAKIIANGRGTMPPQALQPAQVDVLADFISNLK